MVAERTQNEWRKTTKSMARWHQNDSRTKLAHKDPKYTEMEGTCIQQWRKGIWPKWEKVSSSQKLKNNILSFPNYSKSYSTYLWLQSWTNHLKSNFIDNYFYFSFLIFRISVWHKHKREKKLALNLSVNPNIELSPTLKTNLFFTIRDFNCNSFFFQFLTVFD